MESRNYKVYSHSLLSCLLLGLVLVLLNVAFADSHIRKDLTEEKSFTLSKGSQRILDKIVDPVTITVFWGNIPKIVRQERRNFEGILDEIQAGSGGKVSVRWVDADTDEGKDLAATMDIPKLQIRATEGASVVMQDAYAGLVLESGDKEPTRIPNLFQAAMGLQYVLMADLESHTRLSPPIIAFFDADDPEVRMQSSGRGPNARRGRFSVVQDRLARLFSTSFRRLDVLGETVAPEIDILIVAAPHVGSVNEDTVFALDQFALRGGRLILLLDPVSLPVAFKQEGQREPVTSGLEGWLDHLGLTAEYGVVGDFGRRHRGGWATREALGRSPFLPLIHGDGLADGHIVTSSEQLVVPMLLPSALSIDEPKQEEAGRKVEVLLRTSEDGYLRPEVGIVLETLEFATPAEKERGRHTLGVWMEGPAKSFFAGKPSPAEARAEAARRAEEEAEAELPIGGEPPAEGEGAGTAVGSPDGSPPAPAPEPEEDGDEGGDGPEDDTDAPAADGPPRYDTGTVRMMVFGDADMIADYSLTRLLAQSNGTGGLDLLANTASWMAGSADLLEVPPQRPKPRPLEELEEDERSWIKLLNLLAIPLLLLCIGVVVFLVRRSQGA